MKIGVCGLACVDVVNVVDRFPHEDDKIVCSEQLVRRGGNASNTASVLQQLNLSVDAEAFSRVFNFPAHDQIRSGTVT